EEGPRRLAPILFPKLVEGIAALPELQNRPLLGREIDLRLHLVERHNRHLAGRMEKGYSITGGRREAWVGTCRLILLHRGTLFPGGRSHESRRPLSHGSSDG